MPFPPTTRRTFPASEQLHLFARVFAAAPAHVKTGVWLARSGQTMQTLAPQCLPATGTATAIDCRTTLSLAGRPAGTYTIEVAAHAGQERAARAVSIWIE